jgi:thymidylate synthase ThyX
MIEAKVLLDSVQASGDHRLTTWLLTYPRFIHSELMTHRQASRNASSSRAIPSKKRVQAILDNPAAPTHWGKNQPGMQAEEELSPAIQERVENLWHSAGNKIVNIAEQMIALGAHKQVINRITEPWSHITVLFTMVESGHHNFFALRAHPDADPTFSALASLMLSLYNESLPQVLQPGEWHVPFGNSMDPAWPEDVKIRVAVARAARLSYESFDGPPSLEKDLQLHDRLRDSGHWSAFEHIAKVPTAEDIITLPQLQGNLRGWVQLRKTYQNECRADPRVLRTVVVDGVAVKLQQDQMKEVLL